MILWFEVWRIRKLLNFDLKNTWLTFSPFLLYSILSFPVPFSLYSSSRSSDFLQKLNLNWVSIDFLSLLFGWELFLTFFNSYVKNALKTLKKLRALKKELFSLFCFQFWIKLWLILHIFIHNLFHKITF